MIAAYRALETPVQTEVIKVAENDSGAVAVQLRQVDEADDVIGGEAGTVVDMKIEEGGVRFTRTENDYGEKLTERFIPWASLLPPYQDETEMPPVIAEQSQS